MSATIWSAQRSGGRSRGRRHAEGGVEARMSMAWVLGGRRQMCPKALRRSLQIVVVRGGCPVRVNQNQNQNRFIRSITDPGDLC